jgi:hypothetical protein
MRRVVVVGLVGGAVVVAAVAVSRRKAPEIVTDGVPEWAPLRLVEPASPRSPAKWVDPDEHGGCPGSHPIKGNRSSRIFHAPGGAFYEQTKAERCFCDAEAAEADGYRPSKR